MSKPEITLTPAALREWPLPTATGSKHDRGRVVVVGGARGTPGAAILAGLAGLRVGAGHLTLAVAESAAVPVAVAIPECGVIGLPESASGTILGDGLASAEGPVTDADVVLVGPGLDDPAATRGLLDAVFAVADEDTTLVLDAFALGVLSEVEKPGWVDAGRLVLTPNLEELRRLLGDPDASGRPDEVLRTAQKHDAVVSCAGAVAEPGGQVWRIETGHPGLATSGSGDVLAGTVAGFAARGATASQAASWGTFVHAAAGDRLAATVGRVGFLASELLDQLPQLLTELST